MTVDFVPGIDVSSSLERSTAEGVPIEPAALVGVVVQIKKVPEPVDQKRLHERMHAIDRVFYGPFFREKYGVGGDKALENDRIRYYGAIQPAEDSGELAGRRYVHEFDTITGCTRGWHEIVDRTGRVRQVRPERDDGIAKHYQFDSNGRYRGSW